uniref:NADH-ubiquinone oxidoreductase chain 4 n=1 Tax=Ceraphron sp. MM-2014 TaxID=1502696 RepID=A0A096XL11_9HYME|nr:NADH dehydrogenase subunit 4 [Ceraphron sp. MM-2014]
MSVLFMIICLSFFFYPLMLLINLNFLVVFFIYNFNFNDLLWVECSFILDKISLALFMLSLMIWLVMMMSEFSKWNNKFMEFIFMILLLSVGLVFMVSEYLTFYMMFEITLIPMLVYIVLGGGSFDRVEAGIYMLLYTLLVSFPLMLNIFMNMGVLGSMFMFFEGGVSNNLSIYLFIMLSFMVKLPMYMFHLWLPKAHVEASVSGSMLLAGIMLKMGGYGILRFMYSLKVLFVCYSFIFISLSLFGSMLASLESLRFLDMKILVAYSSIVHMGVMLVGILSMSMLGLLGGLMLMISHGICSSGLFGVVNLIYERSGTRSLFFNKGGLLLSSNLLFFWFILCINNMSSPPSLNLFSELFIMGGFMYLFINMIVFLVMIMFFGGVYSIYLFSFSQYGKFSYNFYFKENFSVCDFFLMLKHIFPLNLMFLMMDLYIYSNFINVFVTFFFDMKFK